MHIHLQDPAVQWIGRQDPTMYKLMTVIGDLELTVRTNKLAALVRSIIGQQISFQAADAIYNRLDTLLNRSWSADLLLQLTEEEWKQIGFTKRKISYVQHLAEKVITGALLLDEIAQLNDEAVVKELTQIKGIGKWTAEVFLILTLGREDVLALDDVALQRAAAWLYDVQPTERRQVLKEQSVYWKPYRSIASFYLWEAIHLGFIEKFQSVYDI